jgi:ribosomal protein S18 acetylase RimI-like enzyme
MPIIRRGEAGDLEGVEAIQSASPEAAHWKAADYLQYEFTVAICGGTVAGFLVWRRVAEGEAELLNLAVAPGFSGGPGIQPVRPNVLQVYGISGG